MIEFRKNNKTFIVIQLIVVPLATFFSIVFNESTLNRFKTVFPEYPAEITLAVSAPPKHLIFLHMLGENGIVAISIILTTAIFLFTFIGNPKVSNVVNSVLLTLSMLFFIGVFVSYTIGLLGLTWRLG